MRKLTGWLIVGVGLLLLWGGGHLRAAPRLTAPQVLQFAPPRNSATVPLQATIAITYDTPLSPTTVTSVTFAVHAMQSGLITATPSVVGNTILVTPTRLFHQGELVYAIATTRTLGLDGTAPLTPTQWQFQAGSRQPRCFAGFVAQPDTGLPGLANNSLAWGDYDHDGDLDLLLTGLAAEGEIARIYHNEGGHFTDINAGLVGMDYSAGAWGDYDNDGDLDILIAGRYMARIYRNDAGQFVDIGAELTGFFQSHVAWGDYDGDGDLDILLSGNTLYGFTTLVYRNDRGSFTDSNAGLPASKAAVAWGDYDSDGDLDILLTGKPYSSIYHNTGRLFVDSGIRLAGVSDGEVAWGDYDNDGDLDILLTGQTPFDTPLSTIYRNDQGAFTDVGADLINVRFGSVAWGDYDNDGDLDILLTGGGYNWYDVYKVYRNDSADRFTELNTPFAGGYKTAWGDYDGDGDLDILMMGGYRTNLYRNEDWACGADLALTLTVTPQFAAPGAALTYTVHFTNTGVLTAPAGGVTATLPAALQITAVLSAGVALTPVTAGPDYAWMLPELWPGQSGVITLTGVLTTALPVEILPATAGITTPTFDGDPANNVHAAAVILQPFALTGRGPQGPAQPTAPLTATFSTPIAAATVTSRTWAVHGDFSGLLTGTYAYDPLSRTVTLTPARPLHGGEVVRVSATAGVQSAGGVPFTPQQWAFPVGPVRPRCVGGFFDTRAELPVTSMGTAAWGDYDNDGALDVAITGNNYDYIARIYRNVGGRFVDSGANLIGVNESTAVWGDYDTDGDLDLLVFGGTGATVLTRLYRNDAGTFVDSQAGLMDLMTGAAAWGDYDNDGDLDLVLTGWAKEGYFGELYRNDGGAFVDTNAGLARVQFGAVAWGDYDADGDLDLALAGESSRGRVTRVYRNAGGTFTDIGAGLSGISDGAVAWGDYDGDGDLDLVVTGQSDTGPVAQLYHQAAGSFTPVAAGLTGVAISTAAWGDYDNDGDLDLLLAGRTVTATVVTQLYQNAGGSFTPVATGLPGNYYGTAAWGDYDNDGDLDLLLLGHDTRSRATRVYRNDDCYQVLYLPFAARRGGP